MTLAIQLNKVTYSYYRLNGNFLSIKSLLTARVKSKLYSRNTVVRGVSLEILQGEIIGLIGDNGSGKSTLLRIIAGILPPESGVVTTVGSIAPLMDLGAGFHPELTAGENITLNSALLGRFKVDCLKIADWANLRDKLEDPVRTFSSGMVARLAFSIATDVNPDILLIDEVLSVGDQNFQAKSLERTRSLITSGGTVILVSHNLELLREECSRVIWLDSGGVKMDGDPTAVIDAYRDLQSN